MRRLEDSELFALRDCCESGPWMSASAPGRRTGSAAPRKWYGLFSAGSAPGKCGEALGEAGKAESGEAHAQQGRPSGQTDGGLEWLHDASGKEPRNRPAGFSRSRQRAVALTQPGPRFSHIVYWSRYHLHAARMHMGQAEVFENRKGNHPFSWGHRAAVMSAITSAAMLSEAALNEINVMASFPLGRVREYFVAISEPDRARLAAIPRFAWLPLSGKANRLLREVGRPTMPEDEEPLSSFRLLVDLRNALVHAKPETIDAGASAEEHELGSRLSAIGFAWNGRMEGGLEYPDQILSAGCAKWALTTTYALLRELHARLGMARKDLELEFPDD